LPMGGYGRHQQQQFAPQGGQQRPGQHPSGGSAYPQFGAPGTHQGTSPNPSWPFGPQPAAAAAPAKPKRLGLALVAATALLVGTAGGVGGAAVYSATNDSGATARR
jgi:putative serine protease PepD